MIVDFIYDVATPNGYLAHKVIPEFADRTGSNFNYVPCLAGGIFKLTNNTPPLIATADIKNKADYFFIEMNRFIKKYSLTKFKNNSYFRFSDFIRAISFGLSFPGLSILISRIRISFSRSDIARLLLVSHIFLNSSLSCLVSLSDHNLITVEFLGLF